MAPLTTVLSAIAAIVKALGMGMSVKRQIEAKQESERDTQAFSRHADNQRAIADTIARGVRDARAAREGRNGPPPATSPTPGRDGSGT